MEQNTQLGKDQLFPNQSTDSMNSNQNMCTHFCRNGQVI